MVEPFSGVIASRLTNELLNLVTRRLQGKLFGSDEEQALGRAYRHAFSAMVAEMSESLNQDLASELESQLLKFVSDPEVANALLDIAIERQEPPIAYLQD